MTVIKICGLSRREDAQAAAEAGAHFLGFVFAPSRRRVQPEIAQEIVATVRMKYHPRMVGVFVNEQAAEMNRISRMCELDYVQLSGDEDSTIIQMLEFPAIKVFHISPEGIDNRYRERIESSTSALVLLDTAHSREYGGTGEAFEWSAAQRIERPFLLAGGLRPETVATAIEAVQPWGVDVSSGVETTGSKDRQKIHRFIQSARAAPSRSANDPLAIRPQ